MFFKSKPKAGKEKSAGATLYLDKIILETRNQKEALIWYTTDSGTILPVDAPDLSIGEALLKHLGESKLQDVPFGEIKRLRDSFRKITKLKSEFVHY